MTSAIEPTQAAAGALRLAAVLDRDHAALLAQQAEQRQSGRGIG